MSVADVNRTAVSGARVLLAGQVAKMALQFISLATLSRLLSPKEFGVAAMVTALVAIGEVIRDFGLSTAAVQCRTLSVNQQSNLFWLNVTVGIGLAATLYALAPWVAQFYNEPSTADVTRALCPFFVITAVGAQFRASLIRSTRFASSAVAETLGYCVGVGIAISFAFAGAGVWALIAQQIASATICTSMLAQQARWRPRWPRRHQETMPLIRFGRNVFLTQLLGNVSRNFDSILIGRFFGPVALGVYNRGFQLMMLPMNQINAPATSVALPVLSRVQDEPHRYNALVLRAQAALMAPLMAVLGVVVVAAPAIVNVVLGPGWGDAVPVIRVLGIAAAFQGASYVSYWIFVSRGLTGQHLRVTLVTRPLLVAILFGGTLFGVLGVAVGYTVGTVLIWPIALWWLKGTPGLDVREVCRTGLIVITSFALAAAVGVGITGVVSGWRGVAIGLAAYALIVILLFACWRDFRSLCSQGLRFVRSASWFAKGQARGY